MSSMTKSEREQARERSTWMTGSVARRRALITPEQEQARKEVDERNARLQERGVSKPQSGTFGRAKP